MPENQDSMTPHRLEIEFRPHFAAFSKDPNPTNTTRLLNATKPILDTGIKAFGGQDNPMIRSRAKRLAIDAFKSYNPTQASLKTHVLNHLQGLQRHAAKQVRIISVPERVAADKRHLDTHEAELYDELGRSPSSVELADRTGLSVARQAYVRGYRPGMAAGQAAAAMPGDEDGIGNDPAVVASPNIRRSWNTVSACMVASRSKWDNWPRS
jgi:hypothetical protein